MHVSIFSLLCFNLCPTRVLTWRSYPFVGHVHSILGFWNMWCCVRYFSLPTPPFSFSLQLTFKVKRTSFWSNSGNTLWLEKCYPFSVPFTSWEVQRHLTNWAGSKSRKLLRPEYGRGYNCSSLQCGANCLSCICFKIFNILKFFLLFLIFRYFAFVFLLDSWVIKHRLRWSFWWINHCENTLF